MPHLTPADYAGFAVFAAAPCILVILWMRDIIRPGSFTRGGSRRDPCGVPAVVWLLCAMGMIVSPVLGASAGAALPAGLMGALGSIRNEALMSLLTYTGSAALAVFLIYLLLPRAGEGSGLRARWSDVPVGLGAFLLGAPVVQVVSAVSVCSYWLLTHEWPDEVAHPMLREIMDNRADPWSWLLIAIAVAGAPVVEELVFRVFLTSAMRRSARAAWPAILISAALFALTHRLHPPGSQPVEWHAIPTLFVLGVCFGVAYERTGRLLVPIVMHAAYNGANIVLAMVFL